MRTANEKKFFLLSFKDIYETTNTPNIALRFAATMGTRKITTNLLSLVTRTFLVFSRLENPDYVSKAGENIFFSDSFPAFLRQQVLATEHALDAINIAAIMQVLNRQDIEPTWCFARVLNGYILVMRSEPRAKMLLEWIEFDTGKQYVAEAQKQDRFVDLSLFNNGSTEHNKT